LAVLGPRDLEEIESLAERLLRQSVKNPGVDFKVRSVVVKEDYSKGSVKNGMLVHLKVVTNNRPLISGNFGGLPGDSLYGLTQEYVCGYLQGYFAAKHFEATFHLDIWDSRWRGRKTRGLISFVSKDDAIRRGIIELGSPVDIAMGRYGLKLVELIGPDITAPDPPTMQAVARIVKETKPGSVADLFCGTGSLSKVALSTYPGCKVVGVDSAAPLYSRENLRELGDRFTAVQNDMFANPTGWTNGHFDLAIADPFEFAALDFARKVVPSLVRNCETLLVAHGFTKDTFWTELVRKELARTYAKVKPLSIRGVSLSYCS